MLKSVPSSCNHMLHLLNESFCVVQDVLQFDILYYTDYMQNGLSFCIVSCVCQHMILWKNDFEHIYCRFSCFVFTWEIVIVLSSYLCSKVSICQVIKLSGCQVVKFDPWDMLNFCFMSMLKSLKLSGCQVVKFVR